MIPFASQRAAGQDLATHLQNAYDNEIVQVAEVRGAIADDLHGAFKEWQVQAEMLTKCREYLYSLSINPDPAQEPLRRDQYMDYIARTESTLGLTGQPRAIVFHTKYGRDHCHVVWSRIDASQQKAVHLAFDHEKLMRVTRAFARDHGLRLPEGYQKSRGVGQESLYEREHTRQTGLAKADHIRHVTEAWRHSDTAKAFVRALADRGYVLATGKRDYVLVDAYSGMHALPRLIDDKTVRTKDVRARLQADYPLQSLPSVEEAQKLVVENRMQADRAARVEDFASRLEDLKRSQFERRAELERALAGLRQSQEQARLEQEQAHATAQVALRDHYRQNRQLALARREATRPHGLAAFLARVSGVALIREALHRREDAKQLATYIANNRAVRLTQEAERRDLRQRSALQNMDAQRQRDDQHKIDARELAALMRDAKRDQRIQDRGGGDRMASLRPPLERKRVHKEPPRPDLLASFDKATERQVEAPPDLITAFERASRTRSDENTGRGDQSADQSHELDPDKGRPGRQR